MRFTHIGEILLFSSEKEKFFFFSLSVFSALKLKWAQGALLFKILLSLCARENSLYFYVKKPVCVGVNLWVVGCGFVLLPVVVGSECRSYTFCVVVRIISFFSFTFFMVLIFHRVKFHRDSPTSRSSSKKSRLLGVVSIIAHRKRERRLRRFARTYYYYCSANYHA